jgi:hypothetical protein
MIENVTPWSTETEDDAIRAEIPADEVPSDSAIETNPDKTNLDANEDPLDPTLEEGKVTIKKEGKMIEVMIPDYSIRGQLGSLITTELNEIFKNNDEKDLDKVSGVKIQVKKGDGETLVQESYICLTDLSELNLSHGRELLDQLVPATENYKNVLCYINLNESPKGSIDLAIKTLKDMNVKFVYNKKSLFDYLENFSHE